MKQRAGIIMLVAFMVAACTAPARAGEGDDGGGDPTGACCLLDGTCTETTGASCSAMTGLEGTFQGAGTTCAGTACPQGCCLPDTASCAFVTATDCTMMGGTATGSGTNCDTASCGFGACCTPDGGCMITTEESCVGSFVTWRGVGTECEDPSFECPTGCCYPTSDVCDFIEPSLCTSFGGEPSFGGFGCATLPCPQVGTCCIPPINCESPLNEDACAVFTGSVWLPPGSDCADCPTQCCFDDGSCQNEFVDDCAALGGTALAFSSCETAPCARPGACCLPDGTCAQAALIGGAGCDDAGGTYQGDTFNSGDPCAFATCLPTEACCLGGSGCTVVTLVECSAMGGTPLGAGTECASLPDCNTDGIPDDCQLDGNDCNGNGTPDDCEVSGNDCDGNGIPDDCDIAAGAPDCDGDGVPDGCAIDASYAAVDSNDPGGPAVTYEPPGSGVTPYVLDDDGVTGAIAIGFPFVFFGETYEELVISSNGFVSFLLDSDDGCCSGETIPTPGSEIDGFIAGWWEDLDPSEGGTIRTWSAGTAPQRRFVIEFDEVPLLNGTTGGNDRRASFQIKLFETSDVVEIHWIRADTFTSAFRSYAAGIENQDGTAGIEYYFGTTPLPVPLAVRFVPVADCNGNGLPDACEIADGTTPDCNANGIPDDCDVDCNGNGVPDDCEIADNLALDLNGNGVPDDCEDCDGNGLPDDLDLAGGGADADRNGVLDACEDCDGNGVPDGLDVLPSVDGAFTTEIPYETFPVALDWESTGAPDRSGVVPLPWPVTIGGETFGSFVLEGSGYVELLRDGEAPYETGGASIGRLLSRGNPAHTYLAIAYDDEPGNGVFGYDVQADRVVFDWAVETDCDTGTGNLNTYQLALFMDGSVQWNFTSSSVTCFDNDLFTGVFLGYDDRLLVEIVREAIPEQRSWRYGLSPDATAGLGTDCNGNGVPDVCDIADGAEADCDGDGYPDSCTIAEIGQWASSVIDFSSEDTDSIGLGGGRAVNALGPPDSIPNQASWGEWTPECSGPQFIILGYDEHVPATGMIIYRGDGETSNIVQVDVLDPDGEFHTVWTGAEPTYPDLAPPDFLIEWPATAFPVTGARLLFNGTCSGVDAVRLLPYSADCDGDGVLDACEIAIGDLVDCNDDGIPDACQLDGNDCDANGTPDDCEPDCDGDGTIDACALAAGADDCNGDGIPDDCEIDGNDCNGNGTPDDCELTDNDCNGNETPDDCELAANDCNGNGTPDDCELADNDCNGNGTPDDCELAANDCNSNGTPDDCELADNDCNGNGTPDDCELAGNDCNGNGTPDDCESDCDGDGTADACAILAGVPDCNLNGIPDDCEIADNDCNGNGTPDDCELAANDCNGNGTPDDCEIADNDCNGNGTPDDCEVADNDCNGNGTPDDCEIADNDCNGNGIPDDCEVADNDCNGNGTPDDCELADNDCNGNGTPDDCELADNDCNGNGTPDDCELAANDCNGNGTPDDCELADNDCNGNGTPDDCELAANDCNGDGTPDDCQTDDNDCNGNGTPDDCEPDCDANGTPDDCQPDCDGDGTADTCAILDGASDCNGNGIPDDCDLTTGAPDCNVNGTPDECEPDCDGDGTPDDCEPDCDGDGTPDDCQPDCDGDGTADACAILDGAPDCNLNGIPDTCEPDCNGSGVPDDCDVLDGFAPDCNLNGLPDECDVTSGRSMDDNGNGVPDECEPDCNGNGSPDDLDIATDAALDCQPNGIPDECEVDCNGNGVPDLCDVLDATSPDCNSNAIPDECDVLDGFSLDCQPNGIPDECEGDCNGSGVPDDCDIATGFSPDCNGNGIPDECDLADGTSDDCDNDSVPDDCQLDGNDCNGDGVPDDCQLDGNDCNGNGTPDDCDIDADVSTDCQANGIPDECEEDCNGDGLPDDCETAFEPVAATSGGGADHCADALLVCPGTVYTGTTDGATSGGLLAACDGNPAVIDVWYRYRPRWSAAASFTFYGSAMPIVLEVWDGCPTTGGLRLDCATGLDTGVTVPVQEMHEYWIRIAGVGVSTGSYAFGVIGPDCGLNALDGNENGRPDDCECRADVNGDGVVSYVDLAMTIAQDGVTGGPADVDGSGIVNEADQLFLLDRLGPCPSSANTMDDGMPGVRRAEPAAPPRLDRSAVAP